MFIIIYQLINVNGIINKFYCAYIEYTDSKKRNKKYTYIDCNGSLSFVNNRERMGRSVDADFRHHQDTICNIVRGLIYTIGNRKN
jgi:hypothetical protein